MMTRILIIILFGLTLVSISYGGFGGRKGPLVLEHANILRNVQHDSEQVRILIDSVQFHQDDVRITCDYTEFYATARKAYLRGNVVIIDSGRTMNADEVTYYEDTGVAQAVGRVMVRQKNNQTVRCRRLDYNYDTGLANYRGEVIFVDSLNHTTITGELATYDEILHIADIPVRPKLIKVDSVGKNPITVTGEHMWMDDSQRVAKTEKNVVVVQDTMRATGGFLLFDDSTGFATLTKNPMLVRGRDSVTADSMRFLFKNQTLDDMIAVKDVVTLSPADSTPNAPMNRVTGSQMHSFFTKGELTRIIVWGNAKSRYYIRDKANDNGANVASGDTLKIDFEKKTIKQITVIGGIEGTYYPAGWKKPLD